MGSLPPGMGSLIPGMGSLPPGIGSLIPGMGSLLLTGTQPHRHQGWQGVAHRGKEGAHGWEKKPSMATLGSGNLQQHGELLLGTGGEANGSSLGCARTKARCRVRNVFLLSAATPQINTFCFPASLVPHPEMCCPQISWPGREARHIPGTQGVRVPPWGHRLGPSPSHRRRLEKARSVEPQQLVADGGTPRGSRPLPWRQKPAWSKATEQEDRWRLDGSPGRGRGSRAEGKGQRSGSSVTLAAASSWQPPAWPAAPLPAHANGGR